MSESDEERYERIVAVLEEMADGAPTELADAARDARFVMAVSYTRLLRAQTELIEVKLRYQPWEVAAKAMIAVSLTTLAVAAVLLLQL